MKITKIILEHGRGVGGYTDAQLRLFGFTEENCEEWEELILGSEEPLWIVKMFLGLKDWKFVDKRKYMKKNEINNLLFDE